MTYSRIMGLDIGSKTVGIAVSDLLGITAQGLETLSIDEEKDYYGIEELVELINEYQVSKIVIGLPKNMNNSLGPRAEATLNYGKMLQATVPNIEIIYQDERLTTKQAERILISGDVSRKGRKSVIDKLAATIILQNYLDMH